MKQHLIRELKGLIQKASIYSLCYYQGKYTLVSRDGKKEVTSADAEAYLKKYPKTKIFCFYLDNRKWSWEKEAWIGEEAKTDPDILSDHEKLNLFFTDPDTVEKIIDYYIRAL